MLNCKRKALETEYDAAPATKDSRLELVDASSADSVAGEIILSDVNVNHFENTVSSITSTLLARAIAQDRQAWDRVVDLYGPLVYEWCRKLQLSAEDSRDISQEVFISVSQHLHEFRRDNADHTFLGWLRTITKRKVVDYWRRSKNGLNTVGDSAAQAMLRETPGNLESVSDDEEKGGDIRTLYLSIVAFVRDRVSEQHWEIFFRLTVQQEAPADVAADLGIERSNVYQIKSRILKMVQDEFGSKIQ